jgi:allophanate hydrolase
VISGAVLRTGIRALAARYAAGASVVDRLGEICSAIDLSDPVWIAGAAPEAVLERPRALDAVAPSERGALPLFGIPFAVKDNIDVAGLPTTAGCPAFSYVPERSATVVERLEHAGAVVMGKTNLDQFATGLVGTRSPYGVPANPFDPAYIPGGSSSGSAVAVARGLVSFALGTDTAGSGRIPAGFTGTIGVKPTHGIVSAAGVVPACRSLDCVSIFACDLDDAALILDVAAVPDPRDPYARARPSIVPAGAADPRTFAVPLPAQRLFFGDTEAQRSFEQTVARLIARGGLPVEVDLGPCFATAALLYDGAFVAERTAAVGDFVDMHPEAVLDVTRTIIQGGRRYSAVDAFSDLYKLRALRVAAAPIFDRAAVLVVPTSPTIYRLKEIAAEPYLCNSRLGIYTNFVNLLDLCALAVPAGRYAGGLPIGVTFIAPAFADATLIRFARRFLADGPAF